MSGGTAGNPPGVWAPKKCCPRADTKISFWRREAGHFPTPRNGNFPTPRFGHFPTPKNGHFSIQLRKIKRGILTAAKILRNVAEKRRDAGSFGTLTHISAHTRFFTFICYLFFAWIYGIMLKVSCKVVWNCFRLVYSFNYGWLRVYSGLVWSLFEIGSGSI